MNFINKTKIFIAPLIVLLYFVTGFLNIGQAIPTYPQLPNSSKIAELENMLSYTFNSSNCSVTLRQGDNLQAALDKAQPGDTICLTAGAVFNGNFTLPVKNNPQNKFITLVSTRAGELPPGKRVTPADRSKLAKINSTHPSYTIYAPSFANYYRFVGLELANESGKNYSQVVVLGKNSDQTSSNQIPHHFVFDRTYIHGVPPVYSSNKIYNCSDAPSTSAGIRVNANYVVVANSYIDDIHDCDGDNSTIGVVSSEGAILVQNNFLHASGENFMMGGADPRIQGLIPADVVVRGNHFYKDPRFAGNNYVNEQNGYGKKNLFELKFGKRVWVYDNFFENQWESLNQNFAIVLKTDNQNGGASWAQTADVTFEYNWLKNISGAILVGAVCKGPAITTRNIALRHNIIENLAAYTSRGDKMAFQIVCSDNGRGIDNLIIEHNSVVKPSRSTIRYMEYYFVTSQMVSNNFTLRDNILYGIFFIPGGFNSTTLNTNLPGAIISKNIIVNTPKSQSILLPGNFFPPDYSSVGFIDYNGGNYQLASNSPYKNSASDGKDPGVDISELNRRLSGVLTGDYVPSRSGGGGGNNDVIPPSINITSPSNGATVSGSINITVNASDNIGVDRVEFYVDNTLKFSDYSAPYSYSWDSTSVSNGSHTLMVKAIDFSGNQNSYSVSVVVNNTIPDTIPPTVSLTSPTSGQTLSGTVTISATATDNIAVSGVQFLLNGANLGTEDTTPPYSISWNTSLVSNGTHTLSARARDAAGNQTTSTPVSVVVNNNINCPSPAPIVILNPSNINVGETSTAVAPSGWGGGNFISSNSSVATISGSIITGRSQGTAQISGVGWQAPNGVMGCSLGGAILNVRALSSLTPMVDLMVNNQNGPVDVPTGSDINLSWTSQNATNCTASGDWSGSKNVTGSEVIGNITSSKIFVLSCSNESNSASDSVRVFVEPINRGGDAQPNQKQNFSDVSKTTNIKNLTPEQKRSILISFNTSLESVGQILKQASRLSTEQQNKVITMIYQLISLMWSVLNQISLQ
jgi:hypothetical protein